jgi:Flp pilus assembly protein TadG
MKMDLEPRKTRKEKARSRWRQGQAFVEFAIAIPLLMLISVAIMNFAMAISAYNFVCYGARDATRYAAVRGATSPSPASSSDVSAFVTSEAAGLNANQLTVTTTWTPDDQPNSTVAVKVKYSFQFLVPFVQLSPVNLSSTSKLVISQ